MSKSGLFSFVRRLFSSTADDDGLTEFPVGSREILDFERNLTSIYCTSAFARERRSKNIVQSITWYKENDGKQHEHEYLVVQIKNHKYYNSMTSLKLERTRNPTNSTTSLLASPSSGENWHEVPAEPRKQPSLSFRNTSTTSVRSPNAYPAHDVIQIFDGRPRSSDQTYCKIQFQNKDFTLFSLTIIAKVVHHVHENYHVKEAQCYWFAAMVLEVAIKTYSGNTVASSPSGYKQGTIRDFNILKAADIEIEVEQACKLFKDLIAEKEQMILVAANPQVAITQAKANAQEYEQQAKTKSELAEREAEQAKKQLERALHEAEEAKRETRAKDAEIRRLQQLLAEHGA